MTGNEGQKLPKNSERLLSALLAAPTIKEAARVAKVSESTMRRALANPAFAERLRAERFCIYEEATHLLQRHAGLAAAHLIAVGTDRSAPHTARVSALRAVLEWAHRGYESQTVESRLQILEELAQEHQDQQSRLRRVA